MWREDALGLGLGFARGGEEDKQRQGKQAQQWQSFLSQILGHYNHDGWQEQGHIQGQEGREEENVSNFFLRFVADSF